MHIAYVSIDGVVDPLGFSQVVRLLSEIKRLDQYIELTLVSLERLGAETANVHSILSNQEVAWIHGTYVNGSKGAMQNLAFLLDSLLELHERQPIDLVHSRSYLPGVVGRAFKSLTDTPYLFDFRGYWVDEKIVEGQWFDSWPALKIGRFLERSTFQGAAHIVSLSSTAADDIRNDMFGACAEVDVIPTLADFEEFRPTIPKTPLSFAFVGSLNKSYLVDETFSLMGELVALDDRVTIHAFTQQEGQFREHGKKHNIRFDRVKIKALPHSEMPSALGRMDWGFLLLEESFAKRASMPTKLGEYFACGVKPIFCGCNEDAKDWVRKSGLGLVLDKADLARPNEVAKRILNHTETTDEHGVIDPQVRSHFSLSKGAERYLSLYSSLCEG